jgi:transcriptional regulator GlxA family with amidase domain
LEARTQLLAQIFVEPESHEGRQLHLRYRNEGIAALPSGALKQEIAALALAYQSRVSDASLITLARAVIATLAGGAPAPRELPDPRIALAVELIRARLGGAIPLNSIARAVHLSSDRFRHLFIEQTGVGFRAYLLWLRLEHSLGAYVEGSTLTEAAYAGGFADSAHLSRTFKRMFGIAPVSVRPE